MERKNVWILMKEMANVRASRAVALRIRVFTAEATEFPFIARHQSERRNALKSSR